MKGESPTPEGIGALDQLLVSVPRREVAARVRATAVVTAALDDGRWPTDVEILDALASLIQAASRWEVVAELEAA